MAAIGAGVFALGNKGALPDSPLLSNNAGSGPASDEEVKDRTEKRQQDDNNDPNNLVRVVALDAVEQCDDPQDKPDNRESVI
jgi:hypothetical protein